MENHQVLDGHFILVKKYVIVSQSTNQYHIYLSSRLNDIN